LLLASTESGLAELKKENLGKNSYCVGDPMYDAFLQYSNYKKIDDVQLNLLEGGTTIVPEQYYYLTCHREENTNEDWKLLEIFNAMEQLPAPVVYPVHPRNKERAKRLKENNGLSNIILSEPVGYLESIALVNHAEGIITDSGGLQREAFFAGKKCVTVLDFVCWPETMVSNRNELSRPDTAEILEKISHKQVIEVGYLPFGNGKAADNIVSKIEEYKEDC
jgi:UDP-N-acetylglucosamine 2-epimerase (non-hydrolysing)/UDP-GlcNAc3NAcA epimerase